MTEYSVAVSPLAAEKIAEYAYYIATRSGSARIAERWIDRVYATIQRLRYSPHRFEYAEENSHRDYDIHRQIIGEYLALYTIDDEIKSVNVIGFRHGRRLPRAEELP